MWGKGAASYQWRALDSVRLWPAAYAGIKLTTKQLVGDRTALHFAAEKGNAEVLTSLVAAGAKVNQPSVCGMTALHLAVWHQHVDAVRVLLQAKVRGTLWVSNASAPH